MEFLGTYIAARVFKSKTDTRFIEYDDFTAILESKLIPGRFHEYATKTYIPT